MLKKFFAMFKKKTPKTPIKVNPIDQRVYKLAFSIMDGEWINTKTKDSYQAFEFNTLTKDGKTIRIVREYDQSYPPRWGDSWTVNESWLSKAERDYILAAFFYWQKKLEPKILTSAEMRDNFFGEKQNEQST